MDVLVRALHCFILGQIFIVRTGVSQSMIVEVRFFNYYEPLQCLKFHPQDD
jgi:hypothetical protein